MVSDDEHHQSHYYSEILFKGLSSLCNVLTVQLTQNCNFLLNIVNLIFCILQVDYFNCDRLPSDLGKALVDLAGGRQGKGRLSNWNENLNRRKDSPKRSFADAILFHVIIFRIRALRRSNGSILQRKILRIFN